MPNACHHTEQLAQSKCLKKKLCVDGSGGYCTTTSTFRDPHKSNRAKSTEWCTDHTPSTSHTGHSLKGPLQGTGTKHARMWQVLRKCLNGEIVNRSGLTLCYQKENQAYAPLKEGSEIPPAVGCEQGLGQPGWVGCWLHLLHTLHKLLNLLYFCLLSCELGTIKITPTL